MPTSPPTISWTKLGFILVVAQCLALALLGEMLLNKHRQLLVELTLSRIEVTASDVEATLRTGLRTGLEVAEMRGLASTLEKLKANDKGVAFAAIVDPIDGKATIAVASDPRLIGTPLANQDWLTLKNAQRFERGKSEQGPWLGVTIRDEAGEVAASLVVYAAKDPLADEASAMAQTLWPRIGFGIVGIILATTLVIFWVRHGAYTEGRLRRRIMIPPLLFTIVAGGAIAWTAQSEFSAALAPALESKVQRTADYLAGKLGRAKELGIPLEKLPGVEEAFGTFMSRNPEIIGLKLHGGEGRVLAEKTTNGRAGASEKRELGANEQLSVTLSVVSDAGFITRRLGELVTDISVVLLVAILFFREVLGAVLGAVQNSTSAAASSTQRMQALRLPLFLLILTEELSRAFLPLFIKGYATGASGLSIETEVGLPIAVYMFFFALATPFAGRWADRWGGERVFAAGAAFTIAGFAWTALANSYWELLPARALCAWGYATGTMACQRQLILLSGPGQRARGLALFVGAVGIAAICGTSLGGVLADQFGFRPVFAISALVALIALITFKAANSGEEPEDDRHGGSRLQWSEIIGLVRNHRFTVLMIGAAIPAKVALAGFLFYLVPLALNQENYGPAAIGRALMLYFVLVAAINPVASYLSDRYGLRLSLTIGGGVLIGLGGMAGLIGGEAGLWIGIAALGIGTGLGAASMQALATEVAYGPTTVAVVLRTLERLGSVFGPLIAGAALAAGGWTGAMVTIGGIALGGALLCVFLRRPSSS